MEQTDKYLLSVKEASALFGIGQHRIRQIISEDYDYKYHLLIGRVFKIKKEPFEELVKSSSQL